MCEQVLESSENVIMDQFQFQQLILASMSTVGVNSVQRAVHTPCTCGCGRCRNAVLLGRWGRCTAAQGCIPAKAAAAFSADFFGAPGQ